jgi:hypothetical protein
MAEQQLPYLQAYGNRWLVRTYCRASTSANRSGSMIAIGISWRSAADRTVSPKSSSPRMRMSVLTVRPG